jgi:hypothetical protein
VAQLAMWLTRNGGQNGWGLRGLAPLSVRELEDCHRQQADATADLDPHGSRAKIGLEANGFRFTTGCQVLPMLKRPLFWVTRLYR